MVEDWEWWRRQAQQQSVGESAVSVCLSNRAPRSRPCPSATLYKQNAEHVPFPPSSATSHATMSAIHRLAPPSSFGVRGKPKN